MTPPPQKNTHKKTEQGAMFLIFYIFLLFHKKELGQQLRNFKWKKATAVLFYGPPTGVAIRSDNGQNTEKI